MAATSGVAYAIDPARGAGYAYASLAGTVPAAALVWYLARHYFGDRFQLRSPDGLAVALPSHGALAVSAATGVLLSGLSALLVNIHPVSSDGAGPMDLFLGNGPGVLAMWIACSMLVAPLAEEMLFRGALFASLAQSFGTAAAFVGTTSGFALIHLPQASGHPSAMLSIALLGACALIARLTTRSLWAAVLLHATYNAGVATFGLLRG